MTVESIFSSEKNMQMLWEWVNQWMRRAINYHSKELWAAFFNLVICTKPNKIDNNLNIASMFLSPD